MKSRHRRMKFLRTVFVFIGVLIVLWMGLLVIATGVVMAGVFDAQDSLQEAKRYAEDFAFHEARSSLKDTEQYLRRADRFAPVLKTVAWVPVAGSTIDSVSTLTQASYDTVTSLDALFALGEDLVQLSGLGETFFNDLSEGIALDVRFDDLPSDTKRAVLERLAASATDLNLLVAQMEIIETELQSLETQPLTQSFASLVDPLRSDLIRLSDQLSLVAIGARILPHFGGLRDSTTVLMQFLNQDELRPGGGFIGAYGLMETRDGDISHLETIDVYTIDDAASEFVQRTAPQAMIEYNAASKWYFRDSNWSPDFAVSAQQGIDLLMEEYGSLEDSELAGPEEIEAVIGFTADYVSDLLRITGPITVSGQTFTADNVVDTLEYQVEVGYALQALPPEQRKEILGDLVNAMKHELFALELNDWGAVLDASEKALRRKQMVLYSTDESVQGMLEQVNWAGRLDEETVDVQMVVDANLASLKTNAHVGREMDYRIVREDGQWVGETTVRYVHDGTFDWKTTRYRTYTRVYVPAESALIEVVGADSDVVVEDDLGLKSYGVFLTVEPGETREFVVRYVLDERVISLIEDGRYDLVVYQQIGSRPVTLTLDLEFDKQLSDAVPAEDRVHWGNTRYQLNTEIDQDLVVRVAL